MKTNNLLFIAIALLLLSPILNASPIPYVLAQTAITGKTFESKTDKIEDLKEIESATAPAKPQALTQPQNSTQPKQVQAKDDDALAQTALTNFAGMVQNFIQIVQAPHNPVVVGTNLAQMFVGIINVAAEVMKKSPKDEITRTRYMHEIEEGMEIILEALKKSYSL